MKKLLSLPPNLVSCFHDITGYNRKGWFCTNDPVDRKLGSGGGTAWLLIKALTENDSTDGSVGNYNEEQFLQQLSTEKRILIHAGGQSRRLPAYAPSGKILTPIPVFRWERGQRFSQDLLQLQVPLYEKIMSVAPAALHTMIVSGDVLIRANERLQPIPEADVVCYGLWLGPEIAKDHGVFVSSRKHPSELEFMLQKPSVETLSDLQKDHFYLTDIGVWLFSDKAIKVLMRRSISNGRINYYDLYGTFGCCMGTNPVIDDKEIADLKVAIIPLAGGEFYHFGTSHELLSSTVAIQNLINDQRVIMHHSRKPTPAMFVQNAVCKPKLTSENENLWIENAFVGENWSLSHNNIITGVPENNWNISLSPNQCVDIIPIGEKDYAVRPYGYFDKFAGDLQQKKIFPVTDNVSDMGKLLSYMLKQDTTAEAKGLYDSCQKLSAEDINAMANLRRLFKQRQVFQAHVLPLLAKNHEHSVFYQLDLEDTAKLFAKNSIPEPQPLTTSEPLMKRIQDAMFRSELKRLEGEDGSKEETKAFASLREGLSQYSDSTSTQNCKHDIASDQIVWARSPVRIDIAGGWTDTPPYCLMEGGNVVNLAIDLNGQPPIQTYVKPCHDPHIILRSIDLGASETITTYEELVDYNRVGSPFSIPKAALTLAGFHKSSGASGYKTLKDQLSDFGSGIELTLLSAIPAGSGLGTSSVLAANVLGALSDFCGLGWDKQTIGRQTLVLEQLLTTGGGWQDQFGGILHGVKLLQTEPGLSQAPIIRYLPETLFSQPEYKQCHLLYYTGLRRTAKTILSEIVRRMFLNEHDELILLREMKEHALEMFDAIQREDFKEMGRLVRKTWIQNQTLDNGTNPVEVEKLTSLIDDLSLGYKLPGAGGGGYLYIIAKDPEAAARIKTIINANPINANSRFVDMTLSHTGLQISRS